MRQNRAILCGCGGCFYSRAAKRVRAACLQNETAPKRFNFKTKNGPKNDPKLPRKILSLVLLCRISHRHYSKIFHREFPRKIKYFFATRICRHGHAKTGVFQTGGFPDLDLSFLFCPFFVVLGLSRGFSRFARGWSGDFPDWSFLSFSAYYQHLRGTVPKGSATQSGPLPKKVGNPPAWKPPGLATASGKIARFLRPQDA